MTALQRSQSHCSYRRTRIEWMLEGWLIDSDDFWIWRFHRDEKAWIRDPKVFIDRSRQMPDGPPLLKERRYLPQDEAEQLCKFLQRQG